MLKLHACHIVQTISYIGPFKGLPWLQWVLIYGLSNQINDFPNKRRKWAEVNGVEKEH